MATFLLMCILVSTYLLRIETDAESIGSGSALEQLAASFFQSLTNIPRAFFNPPENKNSSIGYRYFSARNPLKPCFLEPNSKALKNCPVNSEDLTIFLIHGFIVSLNPGNKFEEMKDALLAKIQCNVIIVDWTLYDGPPYTLAIRNSYIIASKIADMIKYLVKNSGLSSDNVVIVGHSLGAHMAGAVGRLLPNLSRIEGLDPAGPLFETGILPRLSYSDAKFVQITHTSTIIHGLGLEKSIGHIDFYINGGEEQPHCTFGSTFRRPSGDIVTVDSHVMQRFCHHEIVLTYFIESILSTDCNFYGTQCDNYQHFKEGKCLPENSKVALMGVFSSQIPDLPPLSQFYMRTRVDSPYCLTNGNRPD